MYLAIQALSLASLQAKETNISNKRNIVKNPNWQEADQMAIYKAQPRIEFGTTEKQIPLKMMFSN